MAISWNLVTLKFHATTKFYEIYCCGKVIDFHIAFCDSLSSQVIFSWITYKNEIYFLNTGIPVCKLI